MKGKLKKSFSFLSFFNPAACDPAYPVDCVYEHIKKMPVLNQRMEETLI